MSLVPASLETEFFSWADSVLSQPIPASTVAFHFNLYEGLDSVHVQLIGADAFAPGEDPSKHYWPGPETFSTGEDIFEVPQAMAGPDWRAWLDTLKSMINAYIARGKMSKVLRNSKGVGVGFVDGDMHLLWQRDAAA